MFRMTEHDMHPRGADALRFLFAYVRGSALGGLATQLVGTCSLLLVIWVLVPRCNTSRLGEMSLFIAERRCGVIAIATSGKYDQVWLLEQVAAFAISRVTHFENAIATICTREELMSSALDIAEECILSLVVAQLTLNGCDRNAWADLELCM